MPELIRIKKSIFYITIISIAIIIFTTSVDTLLNAKNVSSFQLWLKENSIDAANEAQHYQIYLGILMTEYFLKLIVPVIYGLQTYFAYVKSGVGIVYKAIWTVILGAILVVTVLNFNISSPAYYITAALYIVIIITLLNIKKETQKDIGG